MTVPTLPTFPASPAFPANPRLLTAVEVATILRVSKQTVYRLLHAGDLAAIRVGRDFRIPEHAIKAQLAAVPVTANTDPEA